MAKQTPVSTSSIKSQAEKKAIIQQIRQLAGKNRLNGLKIKDLIAEGRK